ncbi:MAG: amidohydrolase [bacterium]|nr:amidohydrolase [bacterium]
MNWILLLPVLTLLVLGCQSSCSSENESPDLILHGGLIYTQAQAGIVEAIAVQEGRVLAAGGDSEICVLAGPSTKVIDLAGRAAYPGFADGHAHLLGIGTAAENLDLIGTESMEDVLGRTLERHRKLVAGDWLTGRGWDQNDWKVQEFPTHHGLSEMIPDRPVLLTRVDGHALLANKAAMDAAGITRDTPDPEGGLIVHDQNGEPTGVFIDAAENLIWKVVPDISTSACRSAILTATDILHRQGITAFHDAGMGQNVLDVLVDLEQQGELKLRLHEMLAGSNPGLLERFFASGPIDDSQGNGLLNVRSIKLYADGALGSRGAALIEPYTDDHGNHGLILTSPEEMLEVCEKALVHGFQVCTHSIGDRGVRQALEVYARAMESSQATDTRFRVEHAQVVHPDDFARFAELGVIPAMQAQHQTSDMPWAESRLGPKRIHGAYAWRSFIEAGCIVPGGSDAPVERLDVVAQFAAAVTRQTIDGEPAGGWYPDQSMTRQEALNMLTTWPAQAAFRENDLGRLAPGYRADLAIFEGDLMIVPTEKLGDCKPVMTVFAGQVVWQAD